MEIRDYMSVLRRGWPIILIVAVLIAVTTAFYTFTRTPLYESKAKVFVSLQATANIQDLVQGNAFTQQAVQSYAEVAVTPIVLDPVIKKLNLNTTAEDLAKRVEASAPLQSVVLTIAARDESRELAAQIANEVSARLSDVAGELTRTDTGISPVKVTAIEPAIPSETPTSPKVKLFLLIGIAGGLLAGFAAAALVVGLRGPRRSKRDV